MTITLDNLQRLIDIAQQKSKGWQESFSDEEWTFRKHRGRLWKVHRKIADYTIDMTGSAVEKQLFIPFSHFIDRLELHHTDANYADSTDSLTVKLYRKTGTILKLNNMAMEYVNQAYTDSYIIILIGDKFKLEPCIYTLSLNTTNLDKVCPVFYVESLE